MIALFPAAIPQHVNTYSMNLFINIPFFSLTSHLLSLNRPAVITPMAPVFCFCLRASFRHKSFVASKTSNKTFKEASSSDNNTAVLSVKTRRKASATQLLTFSWYYPADWKLLRCFMHIWRSLESQRTWLIGVNETFLLYLLEVMLSLKRMCGIMNENREKK